MTTRIPRRQWMKSWLAGGFLWGLQNQAVSQASRLHAADSSSEVRLGILGLGGIDVVGSVGGRGRQLIRALREVPGVRIVALCDVDQDILGDGIEQFKKRGEQVAAHADLRRVLDDRHIDAVVVATPNHWHALATVWACQAGKDVYVEKPFSYNIWEGQQMVAAARKYGRIVQVGTQRRSSEALRQAFQFVRSGALGPVRCVHAIVYRPREGIGKVTVPAPVPRSVDFNLWSGPAPMGPLMRKQLHYEWHWFWSTGNGEIGNNGAHTVDIGRWALGQDQPPPRVMSVGGRFGFDDAGQTPNTQIAIMDYKPAPLICEVRNLSTRNGADAIGEYRGIRGGLVIQCEAGYCIADASMATAFDQDGQQIRPFREPRDAQDLEVRHVANFVSAVRSRNTQELNAEAVEGHLSATCCHMANLSYRLGKLSPPDRILESVESNREMSDAFERCREYLQSNGVDLANSQATLGPWVTFDTHQGRFVDEFSQQANELSRRAYREPFVVPQVA